MFCAISSERASWRSHMRTSPHLPRKTEKHPKKIFRAGRTFPVVMAGLVPPIHVPVAKQKKRMCAASAGVAVETGMRSNRRMAHVLAKKSRRERKDLPPLPTTSASPSVHGARSGGGAAIRSDADAHCGRANARARARCSEIPGDPAHG